MRESSKRFDQLHAGDQVTVLGVRHTVMETHGAFPGSDGLWWITVSADLNDNHNCQLVLKADHWTSCLSDDKRPIPNEPVPDHVHALRAWRATPEFARSPKSPIKVYYEGEYLDYDEFYRRTHTPA